MGPGETKIRRRAPTGRRGGRRRAGRRRGAAAGRPCAGWGGRGGPRRPAPCRGGGRRPPSERGRRAPRRKRRRGPPAGAGPGARPAPPAPWPRRDRTGCRAGPLQPPLPSPVVLEGQVVAPPPAAGEPQVELLDVGIVPELARRPLHHDPAVLHTYP